jgi:hypothetical protein
MGSRGTRTRFWTLRGEPWGFGFRLGLMGVLSSSARSGKLFVLESLVAEGERGRPRFAGEEGMV